MCRCAGAGWVNQTDRKLKVFIAGPDDTRAEWTVVEAAIRLLDAQARLSNGPNVESIRFDGEGNPTGYDVREDGQEQIDDRLANDKPNIIVVVFKNKLGTPYNRDGCQYSSYSAWELERALDAAVDLRPQIGVFQYTPDSDADDREHGAKMKVIRGRKALIENEKAQGKELGRVEIAAYIDDVQQRFGRLSVHQFATSRVFEQRFNQFIVKALRDAEKSQTTTAIPPAQLPRPPSKRFPGYPFRRLQELDFEDHDLFHGRQAKVRELVDRLHDPKLRFLCLYGPSGVGKSSLLKAGVIGTLVEERGPGEVPLRLISMRPGGDPFAALENAVQQMKTCQGGKYDNYHQLTARGLGKTIRAGCQTDVNAAIAVLEQELIGPIRNLERRREPDLLLVIDQFEELWTRTEDDSSVRDAFLRLLLAATRCSAIRVLASLRSDLIRAVEEASLIAELLAGGGGGATEHITGPVIPNELEALIRETAREGELGLSEMLIGALLGDASAVGTSGLPLVTFALGFLVDRIDSEAGDEARREITLTDYEEIGRLPGVVAHSIGEAKRKHMLTGDLSLEYDALFLCLVDVRNVGAEIVPVRRTARRNALTGHGVSAALIDVLVEARVLHVGEGDHDIVALAHDALFQIWEPLIDWIANNRADLAFRETLQRDALEWHRHARKWQRFIKLGPEALADARERVTDRPDLFEGDKLIADYLDAAARRADKVLFVQAIQNSSPAQALDALARHNGDLGLDWYEDCGDRATQLRAGIFAAVTGDDRTDPQSAQLPIADANEAPPDQSVTDAFVSDAKVTQERQTCERVSIFNDEQNRKVTVARGRTPLFVAALCGQLEVVKLLIKLGDNPFDKTTGGHVLVGDAAYGGNLALVRYLVDAIGLNPRDSYADDSEAILWACQRGHYNIVDFLLERGATFHFRTKEKFSCLTEAARGGWLPLVRRLVHDEDFDPSEPTASEVVPLTVAACGLGSGHREVVRFLCADDRVDPQATNKYRWNAMHCAAAESNAEMIDLLSSLGVSPHHCDIDGDTPLHIAARRGNYSIVKALASMGNINLSALNNTGLTPMALAAARGHDRIVRLLLRHGADASEHGESNWSALHFAADDNNCAILDLICEVVEPKELGARVRGGYTAMMVAALSGRSEAITRLRRAGSSALVRDARGETALHLVARGGRSAESLSDADAVAAIDALLDPNLGGNPLALIEAPNARGETALVLAARANRKFLVERLLRGGASTNGYPSGDYRLPYYAARGETIAAIECLRQCLDPNLRDYRGVTALYYAALLRNEELCHAMLADRRVAVDARIWLFPDRALN